MAANGNCSSSPSSGKILVTGATGLLGQHIVRELRLNGYAVRAFVRSASQAPLLPEEIELAVGDIRNSADVHAAVQGCRSVIHACSTHVYNVPAEEMWSVNVDGTRNICDAAERCSCEKLVFTSTVSTLWSNDCAVEFDGRMSPRQRNSTNKRAAELLILRRALQGLPVVIVNPSFFIGPFDYSPSPFRLWIPLATICPVRYVPAGGFNVIGARDVARAHICALREGEPGQRYPVSGENISMQSYVAMVNRSAGYAVVPRIISSGVLRLFAKGKVFDRYVADLLVRANYVPAGAYDGPGFEPLANVIDETVRWFRSRSPLTKPWALVRYAWSRYF